MTLCRILHTAFFQLIHGGHFEFESDLTIYRGHIMNYELTPIKLKRAKKVCHLVYLHDSLSITVQSTFLVQYLSAVF